MSDLTDNTDKVSQESNYTQLSLLSNMPLSSITTKNYEPLLHEAKDHPNDVDRRRDSADYVNGIQLPSMMNKSNRKKDRTIRLLVALNLGLAALLLVLVVVLWRDKAARGPKPPYSPAWEAVRYVNKRFTKDDRFYPVNETDREVDRLWLNYTGPSNGHIKLDAEEARKNVPSVELYFNRGYYLYGLNMFHQMHCLDVIRKAFYPDHYFPSKTPDEVREHKQHCFDFLRQSLMCSGDVTMDHWFNYTWTSPSFAEDGKGKEGDDWMSMYTLEYEQLTPEGRNGRAPLLWDTTHQCRDYDALWNWVKERELVDEAYVAEFGRDVDTF